MAAVEINLDQLVQNLGNAARYADRSLDEIRRVAAKEIMAEMLRLVPRDTGFLASRISIRHSARRTEIGPTGVSYAGYVEFGTPPHEIRPKNAQALRFTIGNRTVYAKSVRHPGTQAQPYVRPAAQKWLESIGAQVSHAAVKLITTGQP